MMKLQVTMMMNTRDDQEKTAGGRREAILDPITVEKKMGRVRDILMSEEMIAGLMMTVREEAKVIMMMMIHGGHGAAVTTRGAPIGAETIDHTEAEVMIPGLIGQERTATIEVMILEAAGAMTQGHKEVAAMTQDRKAAGAMIQDHKGVAVMIQDHEEVAVMIQDHKGVAVMIQDHEEVEAMLLEAVEVIVIDLMKNTVEKRAAAEV
jgi:hypothetical protein